MKIGTKSILFGAHCFMIHPVFVLVAWCKLYGFPWDPRLWIAFFVHDLGYWGKPNMDGSEGETHPELGAKIMGIFGKPWADFTKYHSKSYAKRNHVSYSRLCVADKLAASMEPDWLYLPRVKWSGEIYEYMSMAIEGLENGAPFDEYESLLIKTNDPLLWHWGIQSYMRRWAYEHKDCKPDKWTPIKDIKNI